jgi:hypothetical protein
MAYLPASAAGPVMGTTWPILMVADCAEAYRKNAGAATPKAKADVILRRVKFVIISSTHRPKFPGAEFLNVLFKAGKASFVYCLLSERTYLIKNGAIW